MAAIEWIAGRSRDGRFGSTQVKWAGGGGGDSGEVRLRRSTLSHSLTHSLFMPSSPRHPRIKPPCRRHRTHNTHTAHTRARTHARRTNACARAHARAPARPGDGARAQGDPGLRGGPRPPRRRRRGLPRGGRRRRRRPYPAPGFAAPPPPPYTHTHAHNASSMWFSLPPYPFPLTHSPIHTCVPACVPACVGARLPTHACVCARLPYVCVCVCVCVCSPPRRSPPLAPRACSPA